MAEARLGCFIASSCEEEFSVSIDRSDFFILATTLAAGGAGGWVFRDRSPEQRPAPVPSVAPPAPSVAPPSGPIAVSIVDPKSAIAPACDDSQGTPEPCPSVGPADEAICADVILKRCQDFKVSFKPRVAADAVACLRALKGNERCDAARINQCGHLALMAACPEPAPPWKGQLTSALGSDPPTVAITTDTGLPPTPVASACENLLKACGSQPLAPTLADCRQTLAGANDVGRTYMVECASAHCTDRGLYGCEASPKLPTAAR
jgi:hypothetical protein